MTADPKAVAAALTAVEAALEAFSPPLTLTEAGLDEIDLTASVAAAPATAFAGVEDALEPHILELGEALGEL